MIQKNKIKLIAIIGKAGSGKNTILSRFINSKYFNDNYHLVIPFTTRPIRAGEKEEKDYHFITDKEVYNLILENKIIQVTNFNGWLYGFLKEDFIENKINIGIFNPSAVFDLMFENIFDITTIYIVASKKVRLLRQLNREEYPNVDEIIRRFLADEGDFDGEDFKTLSNLITIDNSNNDNCANASIDFMNIILNGQF